MMFGCFYFVLFRFEVQEWFTVQTRGGFPLPCESRRVVAYGSPIQLELALQDASTPPEHACCKKPPCSRGLSWNVRSIV